MRDDVRLCEVAGRAKPSIELMEERQVQVHLLVIWAVERAHHRLAYAAARLRGIAEEHEGRRLIRRGPLPEDLPPRLFGVSQHDRDKLRHRIVLSNTRGADRLIRRL